MPERIKPNELSTETKVSAKKRIIIAAIIIAVIAPLIFLGGWFYFILVFVVLGLTTYEIATVPTKKLSPFLVVVTFIVLYALVFWIFIKTNYANDWKDFDINLSFKRIDVSPLAIAFLIFVYFFVVIIKDDFTVGNACYLIAISILVALGYQSFLILRYKPFSSFHEVYTATQLGSWQFKYFQSSFLFLYLLIAVCFTDAGAYFIGVLFGKHKINPRISPKKTWEGFVGGLVISTLVSLTFGLIVAHCGFPMLPIFDLNHWYWILLCSLILPIVATLGDFTFSAIKRAFDKKDFSKILGPHGGVLDRIDSIIFGGLALVLLIVFIENNWDFFL